MKSSVNCKSRNILPKSLLLLCEIWLSKQHQKQILQLLRCICITIFEQSFWLKKKLVSVNSPNNYFTVFIFLFDTCLLFSEAVFYKKGVLRNFAKFTGKHLCQWLFFRKVGRPKVSNFIKKGSLAEVFSCEFCKISKNTSFYRTPPVVASVFCMAFFWFSYYTNL